MSGMTRIEMECMEALKRAAIKTASHDADWEQRTFDAALVFLQHRLGIEHSTYQEDMDCALEQAAIFVEKFRAMCQ